MAEADAILLVVDGRAGVRAGDAELAKTLRGSEVPVLVVVNKVDQPGDEHLGAEFPTHGLGSGDLLDRVVASLDEHTATPAGEEPVRIAVVGRPNVGKSSLVNAFLGSERVIVSERAGTTR